jgi:putative FmdB family regulatory protein
MPIYEYRCEKCGEFEHTQRITDPALQRCPTCKRKVRRLISNTSFQLKGSGWYVTDYARAGSGKDKEKDRDKEKKDAGGDTASSTASSDGVSSSEGAAKSEGSASESPKPESKKSAGSSKKADKPARASA